MLRTELNEHQRCQLLHGPCFCDRSNGASSFRAEHDAVVVAVGGCCVLTEARVPAESCPVQPEKDGERGERKNRLIVFSFMGASSAITDRLHLSYSACLFFTTALRKRCAFILKGFLPGNYRLQNPDPRPTSPSFPRDSSIVARQANSDIDIDYSSLGYVPHRSRNYLPKFP